jgi:Protein of unknown function (DUF3050)
MSHSSLQMVAELCGDDPALWKEVSQAAEAAIPARLARWNGVLEEIQKPESCPDFWFGPIRVCDRKNSAQSEGKLQAVCRLLLLS